MIWITKVGGQPEAVRVWNYPFEALEELLANCIYHRNYQEREPVTIRIEPNAIYIYNLGGLDRAICIEDFQKGRVFPQRYRNKRLGDFLKELDLTEGRATGVPVILSAMENNGSPAPIFETDEDRTWFRVTLPIHPAFLTNRVPEKARLLDKSEKIGQELRRFILQTDLDTDLDREQWKTIGKALLLLEKTPKKREEILSYLGLTNQSKNYTHYIKPLEIMELIQKTIPDKPRSRLQRYSITEKGRRF